MPRAASCLTSGCTRSRPRRGDRYSRMSYAHHNGVAWPAYFASVWAFVFACLHLAWATGWYIALDEQQARTAFGQPGFLVYDLVVAAVCVFGIGVALALVRPWGQRLPRGVVGALAWAGTAILVLRSGGAVVQGLYFVAIGSFVLRAMHLWDAWFCLGALLFGLGTWKYWSAGRHSPPNKALHPTPARRS